jgi:nucleotide-binding universal stress UspA family protein
MPVDPFDWQIRKAEAETYLSSVAERLEEVGLDTDQTLVEGRAAETVIDFAQERQVDSILLSSHGQSGISGWNVSSVVQKIILRANKTVLIVRAYGSNPTALEGLHYRRILLPLDGSPRAEVAVPAAAAIARSHGSEILAVQAVGVPEMPRRTPPTPEDQKLSARLTERNRLEAARYLKELQPRLDIPIRTRVLVAENVTAALHELVETEGIDLVVLSAHGYSGETKWPYGSLVISFIAYGSTPLLVIQDLPPEQIEPTHAEIAARELGRR